MALKKSDIRAIIMNEGASNDEKVSAVLDLMHEEADALKSEKASIQKELDDLKESTKGSEGWQEWQQKYEDEHKAFEDYKAAETVKAEREAKGKAYRGLLDKAGVTEDVHDLIISSTNFDEIGIDEKGEFIDADKLTDHIKDAYGKFIRQERKKGAEIDKPTQNSSGGKLGSVADIMKITDRAERRQAIKDNPQLFN